MSTTDRIVVSYRSKEGKNVELIWEPGDEMPYAIEAIESFLGPAQVVQQ